MLQNTDHAGSVVGGAPPQIGRSDRKLRGGLSVRSDRFANNRSV